MKNKKVFIVLLAIFSVICIWNIVNTVLRIQTDTMLNKKTPKEVSEYFSNQDNFDSYKSQSRHSLSLGLDLQGGMFVTLEIGVEDVIKGMAGKSANDSLFTQALTYAKRNASQGNFVDVFAQKMTELNPQVRLGAYFSGNNSGSNIRINTPNDQVVRYLKEEVQTTVDRSYQIIRTRIDQFGVTSPNIQPVPGTNRIIVELPGVKDPERVRRLLRGTANLEFWPTHTYQEMAPVMNQIAEQVKKVAAGKTETETADASAAKSDSTAQKGDDDDLNEAKADSGKTDNTEADSKNNPFLAKLKAPENVGAGTSPEMGSAYKGDTAQINAWLAHPSVKRLIREDVKFMWTYKPSQGKDGKATNRFDLIAIKWNRNGQAPLDGTAIDDTRPERDQNNQFTVLMYMNSRGAGIWSTLTGENVGRSIAVVLDGYVYSYPNVRERISGGSSSITGNFTQEEATDLSNILKAGKLPAPARIEGEEIVGATLGAEAINSGLLSFFIAFLLVIVFVQLYYKGAGTIANITLLFNFFFIIGICSAQNIVMTLPGIAGIILSMAMAVDANVLIYERVREDLEQGKSLKTAISSGFQDALASIIDGNITTFITGVVLFVFGTGPIRGFAVTLMIGIITTLVTALLITRLLLEYQMSKNNLTLSFGNRAANKFFNERKFQFILSRKQYYTIAAVLVVGSLISFATVQFRLGVDFNGGRSYIVDVKETPDVEKIRGAVKTAFKDEEPVIKTVGTGNSVMITTSYLYDQQDKDDEVRDVLVKGLQTVYPKIQNSKDFVVGETKVGPTVAKDIIIGAIYSVFFSLIAMFLYIFLRFQRWQFGLGAILSLAFNVIVVMGVFSALGPLNSILPFSVEVNQTFIGSLLTIVGYTINDTVVVFDRIREKIRDNRTKTPLPELFNSALNETLSRTIVTSITTIVTALVLLFLGGEVLRGFMFAMILGIVIGTFSSVLIASPLTLDFLLRQEAKDKEKAAAAKA